MKKIIILFTIILAIFITYMVMGKINNNEKIEERIEENINMDTIKIKVNDNILEVKLEDNSSSKALVEKLKEGDLKIQAHDYGNFEKVGDLGFNLPTNDEEITTEPGDLILYQKNQITLYYDTNSWKFTKLGKVQNVSPSKLKSILGSGDVDMVLSLGE